MGIKVKVNEDEYDTSLIDFQLFETADEAVKNVKIVVDNKEDKESDDK